MIFEAMTVEEYVAHCGFLKDRHGGQGAVNPDGIPNPGCDPASKQT